jgi:xylulokinase
MGVDSSTQSTKVEIRDADTGALVATGRAPHPPTQPPRSEQDPTVWWNALIDAVEQSGRREVAAISVAGQQHGLVVADRAGSVLRPAKLWNDTEAAPQAARLVQRAGAERWAKAVGSVPLASFTVAKLAWLADNEPEVMERIGLLLLPHDWLTFRLCGRAVTDRGDASGTGYWSPADNAWRPDLVAPTFTADEWNARLPEVLGPRQRADWVAATINQLLGLKGRPLVAPGTGDNMAAALGVGLAAGEVAISVGTSGTVYAVSDQPTADATGAVAGFADATGRFLPLVCTLNAAKVTTTVAALLGVDHEELAAMALLASPGAGGLVLLPYLDGERTPNRPSASGVFSGLRTNATREDVARAAFEGVICGLLDGLDALISAEVTIGNRPIKLVGGGARSLAYRQLLADLSGRPVLVPTGAEHVATGACVQAAAVLADASPEEVARAWNLGKGRVTEPRDIDRAAVREAYAAVRDGIPH